MPSSYQEDLYYALASKRDVDIHVIYARHLSQDRLDLGWSSAQAGYSHQFLSDSNDTIILKDSYRALRSTTSTKEKQLHIVNGIWAEPAFTVALAKMAAIGIPYALYSEGVNPYKPRKQWKRHVKSMIGTLLVKRAAGVLPVATFGEDLYRKLGVAEENIYPFGYFRSVNPRALPKKRSAQADGIIKFIYVGQLVHRKRVDLLLQALAQLRNETDQDYSLSVIGVGEEADRLQQMAVELGIQQSVLFLGKIAADKVPLHIAEADCLVLPSRWDGWGVVVNEALQCGTPVIVSDTCGASSLIDDEKTGFVFESGNVEDMARCMRRLSDMKRQGHDFQPALAAISNSISADKIADYLICCVNHMITPNATTKPIPPWRTGFSNANITHRL